MSVNSVNNDNENNEDMSNDKPTHIIEIDTDTEAVEHGYILQIV